MREPTEKSMRPLVPPMNLKRKFVNHVKAFMIPVALYLVVLLLIPERVGNLDSIISMLTLAVVPTMVSYGAHFFEEYRYKTKNNKIKGGST